MKLLNEPTCKSQNRSRVINASAGNVKKPHDNGHLHWDVSSESRDINHLVKHETGTFQNESTGSIVGGFISSVD